MRVPWWVWVLAGCIVVAGLVAPFASSLPDGLESTIERMNLGVKEGGSNSPLPDYEAPGVGSERVGIFAASAVGIVVVFAATYLFGRILSRREKARTSDPQSEQPDTGSEQRS